MDNVYDLVEEISIYLFPFFLFVSVYALELYFYATKVPMLIICNKNMNVHLSPCFVNFK